MAFFVSSCWQRRMVAIPRVWATMPRCQRLNGRLNISSWSVSRCDQLRLCLAVKRRCLGCYVYSVNDAWLPGHYLCTAPFLDLPDVKALYRIQLGKGKTKKRQRYSVVILNTVIGAYYLLTRLKGLLILQSARRPVGCEKVLYNICDRYSVARYELGATFWSRGRSLDWRFCFGIGWVPVGFLHQTTACSSHQHTAKIEQARCLISLSDSWVSCKCEEVEEVN